MKPKIELRPRREVQRHKDRRGNVIAETPIFPNGVEILINGICAGYADGPGASVSIIRYEYEVIRTVIELAVEEHYAEKPKEPSGVLLPPDEGETDNDYT
jgi:hypothetical protein